MARRRITRVRVSRKPKASSKKTIRNEVKKVLRRQLEKKVANFQAAVNMGNAVNTTAFPTNCFPVTPYVNFMQITQGTTQTTRIGNEVRPVYAKLKLMMFPNPYTVSSNTAPMPQGVEIYIFSVKGTVQALSDAQVVVSAAAGTFFQNASSSIGFQGNAVDSLRIVNTNDVTVYYHKRVKLGAAIYSSNTGAQANAFHYANNDYKLNQTLSIDLMKNGFPRKLIWNDTGTTPESKPLFCIISPWDCDGGAALDTTAAIPANFLYSLDVKYTDA